MAPAAKKINTYKPVLEKEYYILMPNKIPGELLRGQELGYSLQAYINVFSTEEEYLNKCKELAIKPHKDKENLEEI